MRYEEVEWELASCQGLDSQFWFPRKGDDGQVPGIVSRICGGCDIKEDCLQYAIDNKEIGVWGGVHFSEHGRGYDGQRLDSGEIQPGGNGDLVPEVRSGTPSEMPTNQWQPNSE